MTDPFDVTRTDERGLTLRVMNVADEYLEFNQDGASSHGWAIYWDEASKTLQFRYARLGSKIGWKATTSLSEQVDEANAPIGSGAILMNGVWAGVGNGKYRYVDFKVLTDQIAALTARVAALEAA